eukprot:7296379-Pyramimonas_sp.AAC.1
MASCLTGKAAPALTAAWEPAARGCRVTIAARIGDATAVGCAARPSTRAPPTPSSSLAGVANRR